MTGDGSPEPPADSPTPVAHGVHACQRLHVGRCRTDVLGREVATAELVDRLPERAQHRFRVRRVRMIEQDDRLAAALVQPGDRGLVRHRFGKPQHIGHRVGFGRVGPEADAAERRTQRRRVDGDDRPEAGRPVGDEHNLLVAPLGHPPGDRARIRPHRGDAT